MSRYTPYQSQYFAHRITLEGVGDDAFAKSLSTARVEMNPHQVDAALFALQPPIPRGAILADEVGLGKTIEASLVIAQRWAERKRRILLIVPASLRKQWTQELFEKFGLKSIILEAKSYKEGVKKGEHRPFEVQDKIVVTSYEFGAVKADDLAKINWDLVIFDEAHRLRNVFRKGSSRRAKALRDALKDRFKLLLTATPLQNSLMELYGLVSIVDERLFGDEKSFKSNYGGARVDPASLLMLRDRLKPVCRRTLRKDVQEAGHINYTKRIPATFKFEPDPKEVILYESLSEFLRRKDTVAFGAKPNQLVTLVIRKILGSSTFAVADTLVSIIDRLQAMIRVEVDDLSDIDTLDEMEEEWSADDDEGTSDDAADDAINLVKLKAEIEELEGYLALARSIPANAKGGELVRVLPDMLERIEKELGGKRKAVIFTESVRTQRYLSELLGVNGFAGKIALMNGANKDAESQAIYAEWLARHKGSDVISGSKTADMKAAIVEAFRDKKTILIATESGAEGINLQFCSLVVNFDLPWNPQRVEQRIGRCHRYGQKIDVLVVNLLNLKNRAEERVFQLLESKFKLFEGVFGASDEVLGAIESGTDFAKRVFEIHQGARSNTEIDTQFDQLTLDLSDSIKAETLEARSKLIGFFDQDVVRVLKNRKDTITRVMDEFEERLVTIARAELPEATFTKHTDGSPCFDYEGVTWTTGWPLADEMGWKFFRLSDESLARELVDRSKARALPLAAIRFDYRDYQNGQLADVQQMIGQAGWLRVSKLAIKTAEQTVEHILISAQTDAGVSLDERTIDRLFLVPAEATTELGLTPPQTALSEMEAAGRKSRIQQAEDASAAFLLAETDKLDAYADDLEKAADAEIKGLEDEMKARRKAVRSNTALSVGEKVEEGRAIKKLEARRDELMLAKFERKKAIRREVEDILDSVQASLKLVPALDHLFTVRWELQG
jgi:superfamily II DNA or RNA helicase